MEIIIGIAGLILVFLLLGIAIAIVKFTISVVVKFVVTLIGFSLISSAVFYVLDPILSRTVNLSQNGLWLLALALSAGLLLRAWTDRDINFRKYGTLAIALNFLMSTLPLWIMYETSHEGIRDLQAELGIEPVESTSISLHAIVIPYWISINLSTFIFYALDKQIAIIFPKDSKLDEELDFIQTMGRKASDMMPFIRPSRIPERILHWHSYLGGSFGAYIARNFLRHKSSKEPFSSIFRRTIWIQILFLGAVFLINKFAISR
jgi:uncharacterized membrane protein YsdA (DUF1294 family)